jgi:hypothetical protein
VAKFPKYASRLKMLIPFTSVVAAGTISLLVIRRGELEMGVPVSRT